MHDFLRGFELLFKETCIIVWVCLNEKETLIEMVDWKCSSVMKTYWNNQQSSDNFLK